MVGDAIQTLETVVNPTISTVRNTELILSTRRSANRVDSPATELYWRSGHSRRVSEQLRYEWPDFPTEPLRPAGKNCVGDGGLFKQTNGKPS